MFFLWYQQISGNIDFSLKPVSGRLLFNANSAMFQIPVYHDENKLIFNEMMMNSALYKSNTLIWIFIVLAHWHNSPRIDMSPHSDTLSWFRAVESGYFSLVLREATNNNVITNKTNRHDISEILLNVAFNIITPYKTKFLSNLHWIRVTLQLMQIFRCWHISFSKYI
jgi:hypothetical protein